MISKKKMMLNTVFDFILISTNSNKGKETARIVVIEYDFSSKNVAQNLALFEDNSQHQYFNYKVLCL